MPGGVRSTADSDSGSWRSVESLFGVPGATLLRPQGDFPWFYGSFTWALHLTRESLGICETRLLTLCYELLWCFGLGLWLFGALTQTLSSLKPCKFLNPIMPFLALQPLQSPETLRQELRLRFVAELSSRSFAPCNIRTCASSCASRQTHEGFGRQYLFGMQVYCFRLGAWFAMCAKSTSQSEDLKFRKTTRSKTLRAMSLLKERHLAHRRLRNPARLVVVHSVGRVRPVATTSLGASENACAL